MYLLIVGLVLFLGMHSVSAIHPGLRDRVTARIGVLPWQACYAVVSLSGLVLIVHGYADARTVGTDLYSAPAFGRHLAMLLMLFVFPLLLSTYLPGRIQARARHPMLLATALWAGAHLLANGALVDVILFTSFLFWALFDLLSMARRPALPVPGAPRSSWNDVIAVILGLGIYAALVLGGHAWLTGVPLRF